MAIRVPSFTAIERRINDDSYSGWCTKCGQWTSDTCEPDVSKGQCPKCETNNLYGAEELLVENLFVYNTKKKKA